MSKVPDFEYKFHIGKKKPSTVRFVIVGVVLGILADILAKYLKVPQQNIWDLIDEIGRTFKIEDINNLVLAHSKLLERRIERDIDNAIEEGFSKALAVGVGSFWLVDFKAKSLLFVTDSEC